MITIGTMLFFASSSMNAQVSISVNIGVPTVYAPVVVRPAPVVYAPVVYAPVVQAPVEYYYIPDIQCYYDVQATQYIYLASGAWTRSYSLPSHYNYNINNGYKVVLTDCHGARPYANYSIHKTKYYKGYRGASHKNVVYNNNQNNYNNNQNNYNNNQNNYNNNQNNQRNYVAYNDSRNTSQGRNSYNTNTRQSTGNAKKYQNYSGRR